MKRGPSGNASNEKDWLQGCHNNSKHQTSNSPLRYSIEDKFILAQGIASVYLHCLSLWQNDTVYNKTLIASIFGSFSCVRVLHIAVQTEVMEHTDRSDGTHCRNSRCKILQREKKIKITGSVFDQRGCKSSINSFLENIRLSSSPFRKQYCCF